MFCRNYSDLDTYTPSKSNWNTSRLPNFQKNFYNEHPISKSRSDVGYLILPLYTCTCRIIFYQNCGPFVCFNSNMFLLRVHVYQLYNFVVFLMWQMEIKEYWRSKAMYLKGTNIPKPCLTFEEANLPGMHCMCVCVCVYFITYVRR